VGFAMNINAIPVASVQTAAPALNPKIRSLVEGPILPAQAGRTEFR
jgi:hypothetical protein